MNLTDSQKKIFAILFAAGEPLETDRLAEALAISHAEAAEQCVLLQQRLAESELPLELRRLENSWQLCTITGYDAVIRTALELRSNTPLSNAAMEVLAVVAYNQPVTRSFIEQVRGVDSSSVVASLEEKGLIEEAGRMELPGPARWLSGQLPPFCGASAFRISASCRNCSPRRRPRRPKRKNSWALMT